MCSDLAELFKLFIDGRLKAFEAAIPQADAVDKYRGRAPDPGLTSFQSVLSDPLLSSGVIHLFFIIFLVQTDCQGDLLNFLIIELVII